jgi:hypothetical protein
VQSPVGHIFGYACGAFSCEMLKKCRKKTGAEKKREASFGIKGELTAWGEKFSKNLEKTKF